MNVIFILLLITLGAEATSFGEGTGRIWLDNVQCTGNERQLRNCVASSNEINSCTHAQDAGVRCSQGICTYYQLVIIPIPYCIVKQFRVFAKLV